MIIIFSQIIIGGYSKLELYNRQPILSFPKTNGTEINIITPANKTYSSPMTGYYPATYGFEDDNIGESPYDWVFEIGVPCTIQVIGELDGHENVVELYDGTNSNSARMMNNFTAQIAGTIEMWFRRTEPAEYTSIRIKDPFGKFPIDITSQGGMFRWNNQSTWNDIAPCNSDQWYHLRIDFNCTSQKFDVYVDEIRYLTNISFQIGSPSLVQLTLETRWVGSTGYYTYYDAIGYSWDENYNVGDNLNQGILLSYNSDPNLEWIAYSLDGLSNITINGNITLRMPDYGVHSIQLFGNDTMGIYYSSDLLYFTYTPIDIITPENVTYTSAMNGYFPATYGFEDERVNNLGEEIRFIDQDDSVNGYVKVISETYDHKNVLECYDPNVADNYDFYHYFTSPRTNGTIEFWWSVDAVDQDHNFVITDSSLGGNSIYLGIRGNNFQYYDDTWDTIISVYANMWYHIRIDFECGTGTYKELIADTFYIYINEIKYGPYNFRNSLISMDRVRITSYGSGYSYFDAIGFSWISNYSIGANLNQGLLLSYTNSTGLDWVGYSLDGSNNVNIQGNKTIPIINNGLHSIQLFANDTIGNPYVSELRYFTLATSGPSISILSPSLSQYFGIDAPDFSLNIQGVNLDKKWYTLDGGLTNITFNSNTGTISQIEWDKKPHGSSSIRFYANDSFNRWDFTSININKDLNPPATDIYYTAYSAPNKVISSTTFALSATDNSESGVSVRRYKVNDGSWQSYIVPFTLSGLGLGNYTITYQSIDNVGNIETEKYLEVLLISTPLPPPPPLDYTFIIYIVIGMAIAIFSLVYIKLIRPKTADARARKKEIKMERARLRSELIEQQRREQERLRQALIEKKTLERERIIQQQMERDRLERERLEQVRIMREREKQRQVELLRKQRIEEEHAIIDKIRKVMNVSTRVKMDSLRDYLKMDNTTFNQKIFDWAAQFNFTIDGDYLNIRKENVSDFIDELEKQFSSWRRTEEDRFGKL